MSLTAELHSVPGIKLKQVPEQPGKLQSQPKGRATDMNRRNQPSQPNRNDAIVASLLCVLLAACGTVESGDTAAPMTFQIDPTCTETAPLDVVLGEWLPSEDFEPITEEDPPLPIFGPQGGQHFLVALEVDNPALNHPGARLSFQAGLCAEACEDESQWRQVGSAEVDSLDDASNWLPQGDGTLRLGSFFLVLENWEDDEDAE